MDIIVARNFGSIKQVSMAYARNVAYAKLKHFTVYASAVLYGLPRTHLFCSSICLLLAKTGISELQANAIYDEKVQ